MTGVRPTSFRTPLVCLVLFLGTVAVFSRSLGFGFINYDDPAYVVNNIHVQRGLSWESLQWAFSVGSTYWHPLTWVSLMADHEMFGDDARGYHLVNVLWHALNTLLVFVVARRMSLGFWMSAFCAALFSWHPLRVESVTWITERKDVLSGFFGLVAIWGYLRYGELRSRAAGAGSGRPWAWYVFTLVAFAGALMSKSVFVTLPVIFVLFDFWPLRLIGQVQLPEGIRHVATQLVVEKLPFLLLSFGAGLATIATQETAGAFALSLSPDLRVANAVVSIVRYLGLFLWPAGLAVMYPHPGHWPWLIVGAALVVVVAITGLAWWQRRTHPRLLVGWGWFLCLLAPTLGLLQVGLQAMADRYTYLSIVGIQVMLLGAAWPWTAVRTRGRQGVVAALAAVILAGCVIRSWQQQGVWRDADTLFAHTLAVTKDNYVAHAALALGLLNQGRLDEAAAQAEAAVAIAPDSPLVVDALAMVRSGQGRWDEAIAGFRRAIELQSHSVPALCDLAQLLLRKGEVAEAESLFTQAVERRPEYAAAHLGLADVALARERPEVALTHLTTAATLSPREGNILMRLAGLQVRLGRKDEGAATLLRAAQLAPGDLSLQLAIGDSLGQLGRFTEAIVCYETAVRVAPHEASAHARLGYAQYLNKRPDDAIRSWEEAIRLDPKLTELNGRIRQAREAIQGRP